MENIKVYTPISELRNGRLFIASIFRDLVSSRSLAWRLLVRDISAQYRQSYLGVLWAFVPPLALAGGLLLARNANVVNIGETTMPYAAYVMLSMVLWQTFTESLMSPIDALNQSKTILTKIYFHREALVLSKIGQVLFNFSIKLVLVALIFLWFKLGLSWSLLLAPIAVFNLIILGFFIGLLLAPLGGLYTDITKGLLVMTSFWLFITPVIFPVPDEGVFGLIVSLNPVTPLLVTARELIAGHELSHLEGFVLMSGLSWGGLLLAWITFRAALPHIIERMGS